MKGLSREKIRYKVPGVCNRFLQVHKGVLFLCIFFSVAVLLLTALGVRFHQSAIFNDKPVLFVCSAMTSEEEAESLRTGYKDQYSSVLFLRYDGFEAKDAESSAKTVTVDGVTYDIGAYASAIAVWDLSLEDCVCLVFRSDGKVLYSFATYANIPLDEPRPLSAQEVRAAVTNMSVGKGGEE